MGAQTCYKYLAGFLDGDGSIYLSSGKSKNSLRIFVVVTQKYRQVIDLFRETTGLGRVRYIERETNFGEGQKYLWILSDSKSLRSFLPKVIPHLIVKKRKAKIALRLAELKRASGYVRRALPESNTMLRKTLRKKFRENRSSLRGASFSLCYLAGLVDSDGYLFRQTSGRLLLGVTQGNRQVLDLIREQTGVGCVIIRSSSKKLRLEDQESRVYSRLLTVSYNKRRAFDRIQLSVLS